MMHSDNVYLYFTASETLEILSAHRYMSNRGALSHYEKAEFVHELSVQESLRSQTDTLRVVINQPPNRHLYAKQVLKFAQDHGFTHHPPHHPSSPA